MGGGKSQIIDPNANQHHISKPANQVLPNQQQENQQMLVIIKEAFRNCAQNGSLTKDKFNQALSILEALGFKRLRDTPLADRLFFLFDKNKSGQIVQTDFINGISEIIGNQENAITFTFKAYDKDGDNMISKKEFMLFIQDTWKAAFRLLSQDVESGQNYGIKIKDIESWTVSKVSILNQNSAQIFNKYSNGAEKIDFFGFKNFILNSGVNDVTAQLDKKTVLVPLTLTNLH